MITGVEPVAGSRYGGNRKLPVSPETKRDFT